MSDDDIRAMTVGYAPDAGQPGAGRGGCRRMSPSTTWRTDDPCPVCGTGLTYTDDGVSAITQDCCLCGWSATWQAGMDGEAA